jgi:hypothetical protein
LPRDVDHGRLEEIFSNYNEQLDESTGYLTMIDETEMNNAVSALDGQVRHNSYSVIDHW